MVRGLIEKDFRMKSVAKPLKILTQFIAVLSLATGCSSMGTNNSELDKKIANEKPAQTPDEIARRGANSFISAPGLTEVQRQKLMEVYTRTYLGAEEIRGQIGQSKSLLFKMVAKSNYKSKEMEELRNKVVALDQKRLQIMFQALSDVQGIVGYGGDKEEFYRHFEMHEMPVARSHEK